MRDLVEKLSITLMELWFSAVKHAPVEWLAYAAVALTIFLGCFCFLWWLGRARLSRLLFWKHRRVQEEVVKPPIPEIPVEVTIPRSYSRGALRVLESRRRRKTEPPVTGREPLQ